MPIFLFVALNPSQDLLDNLEYNRKNNGGVGPMHLLKRKQNRVGSNPAAQVRDFFVGSHWVQHTCQVVLVMCIILPVAKVLQSAALGGVGLCLVKSSVCFHQFGPLSQTLEPQGELSK